MVIVIQDNSTKHFDVFEQCDSLPIPRVGEEISFGYVPATKVTRVMWLYKQFVEDIPMDKKIKQHVIRNGMVAFIEVE